MQLSRHPQDPKAPCFLRGLSDIAANYDAILCDVWGVVHNGVAHFAQAVEALRRFRAKGGRVVLITNAPRPNAKIIAMLDRLKVPHDAYDGVVSSGDVTVALVAARGAAPVAYLGPDFDQSIFIDAERATGHAIPRVSLKEAAYVVCTGLIDARVEKPEDYRARFEEMKARRLDFICANPDIVVELGDKLFYCAGALAELYEAMGGTVIQAGKPYAPIYDRALAVATGQGEAIDRSRVLAIGDGINTDIKGGANYGVDTLFVTSGIHRQDLQGEAGALDLAAHEALCEAYGVRPMAVLSELLW
jgi:HAD superfamily hydrolase (TIGR01459 family)